jgi:hypothetical protein
LRDVNGQIDAPAHRDQREMLQAEWHQQAGDDTPGQCPHRRDRHGDHVGERRIQHQVVEVIDRERLGAEGRDHCRHRHRAAIAERLVDEGAAVKRLRQSGAPGLVHRNQSHDRAERHLEAHADEARRIEGQHDQRRQRADPHRQPQPVEQDRGKDDPVHDKGALGRDRRAGDDQVAEQDGEGRQRGDLLDRIAQRQKRDQRQTAAHREKHKAADQAEMQPGDRQQMRQA